MGAAGIEVEQMSFAKLDRIFQRMKQLRALGPHHPTAARHLTNGINRARARDPRLLKLMEAGTEILRRENDAQTDRFDEHQLAGKEYSEYGQWREAYVKVQDPHRDDVDLQVYRWLYAALAETLG